MTTRAALADHHQSAADARLGLAVSALAAGGFALFVALPHQLPGWAAPAPLDVLWALGATFSVLVGPVVAGLSGWASLVALWCRGGAMSQTSRRTHLVTLVLVAALLGALASSWGAGVVAWWAD